MSTALRNDAHREAARWWDSLSDESKLKHVLKMFPRDVTKTPGFDWCAPWVNLMPIGQRLTIADYFEKTIAPGRAALKAKRGR